jgi:hypothetical protein
MSYLDLPRLCFIGKFQADVSTSNNDPCHFAPGKVKNPWWNSNGSNCFQFQGATVTSVTLAGGVFQNTAADDPIVTTPVISTNNPQMGKLVDLDPEQQMVSQVWGLQLCIGDQSSGNYVLGNFQAVNFRDMTGGRCPQPADQIGGAGATYLSVMDVLEWGPNLSNAMSKLQTASGNLLSVRFVVDLYDDMSTLPNSDTPNPNFTWGRVCGAVGPANPSDPRNFVVGRFLRIPATPSPAAAAVSALALMKSGAITEVDAPTATLPPASYNYAPAIVDVPNDHVAFDFGNSLCVTASGESYPGMGTLQVATSGGTVIGPIPATTDDYTQRSWIYDFNGNGVAAPLATQPLALLENGSQVLVENPNGTYVDFTEWVYRANAGDPPLEITVMTLQWGQALADQTVGIVDVSSTLLQSPPPKQFGGVGCTNMPFSTTPGLSYKSPVKTGNDGTVTFHVTLSDPGDPRDGLEGQVYAIAPQWDQDGNPDGNIAASILLHSNPPVPDTPQWATDVLPTFAQYMKLYPFMKARMDLTNEQTVKTNASVIANMLQLPITDPRFMPVTRDLSSSKLQTILKWLRANGASTPPSPPAH